MESVAEPVSTGAATRATGRESTAQEQEQWAPLVDVIETGEEYLIRADLPGVSKDGLSVTLDDGELTITGSRAPEALPEGARYVFDERPHGTFTRTFILPGWADDSRIEAEFKLGVLTVRVQKAEYAKARTIAIRGD
jgi:HSP20 family protein